MLYSCTHMATVGFKGLMLTAGEQTADVQSVQTGEVCVDDVPTDHPLLNVKTLEEEGQEAFNTLLSYQSSAHISR